MDATTRTLAEYAVELAYEELTPSALHEVKRKLVDGFGCALGGFDSEPSAITRRLASARSGTPAARIIGAGTSTSPEMAALANAVMVRYLDANDTYISPINGTAHPSDMIPGILAVAEAVRAAPRQLILAVAVAYEVVGALADAVALRDRGWDQGLYIVLGTVAGAGRLLGLSVEQMADALAIAVTANVSTRETRSGELGMWKGVATPTATSAGVFAAELAKAGMTGPTAGFEGRHGVWEQVTGQFALGAMGGQAPLWMALKLRERVKVEEIAELTVRTYWMAYSEIGSEPAKWDPQTRETADHSLPYLLAMALRDGAITASTFDLDRVRDASLRPLLNRVHIEESPELTQRFPGALPSEIEVVTTSGQRLTEHADYPKGHIRNPMTDADVESKFRGFAGPFLGDDGAQRALDMLWRVDELQDVAEIVDRFAWGS